MRVSVIDADDQRQALLALANLTQRSILHPNILTAARRITNDVEARNDYAELEAIYRAVKSGTPVVPGMGRGLRYVSDPRQADAFMGPSRILKQCRNGACSGDCDEASALCAALAGAIGFKTGLRAWGPKGCNGDYVHVYAMAGYPKHEPTREIAMDTTVPEFDLGSEPGDGEILSAWLE
jgi:hypothetical protein